MRKSVSITQNIDRVEKIPMLDAKVVCNPPSPKIYEFEGYFQLGTGFDFIQKETLNLENTLWMNTVYASQGHLLALVVYTGVETRAIINGRDPKSKFGIFDEEMNFWAKSLILLMLVMAFVIVGLGGFVGSWYINYIRDLLLLSSIIPISLKVNQDIAKISYCGFMMKDKELPGVTPRNTNIPEELGRVQYILSDKTGTLTQNDMTFKKVRLEWGQFDEETLCDLKELVKTNCQDFDGPVGDLETSQELRKSVSIGGRKKKSRDVQFTSRDLITALAVCHNVTPTFPEEGGAKVY
mmetsp:Transcript_13908/g.10027  ORF Transcript_13908/g.10027 Transcript_13908/m.10027 type:complete len:295 (+) Transcript_13908:576-1460(+)